MDHWKVTDYNETGKPWENYPVNEVCSRDNAQVHCLPACADTHQVSHRSSLSLQGQKEITCSNRLRVIANKTSSTAWSTVDLINTNNSFWVWVICTLSAVMYTNYLPTWFLFGSWMFLTCCLQCLVHSNQESLSDLYRISGVIPKRDYCLTWRCQPEPELLMFGCSVGSSPKSTPTISWDARTSARRELSGTEF